MYKETMNTKFLGLQIDNHIHFKNHIEKMMSKLSGACYAIRSMVHISNINTEINLLCILSFCYKIWNNLLGLFNSGNIFTSQKKIIRIVAVAQPRTAWRSLFKQLRDSVYSMSIYTFH